MQDLKWVGGGGGKKAVVTKAAVGGGCKGRIYYASGMKTMQWHMLSIQLWVYNINFANDKNVCIYVVGEWGRKEKGEGSKGFGMSKR